MPELLLAIIWTTIKILCFKIKIMTMRIFNIQKIFLHWHVFGMIVKVSATKTSCMKIKITGSLRYFGYSQNIFVWIHFYVA